MPEIPIKQKIDILFTDLEKKQKEEEALEIKKSKRFFKTPKKIKLVAKKKIKQNKVVVFWVSEIGNMSPEWCKLDGGIIYNKRNGIYYDATNQYLIKFMGKYPCIIIPEGGVKPFNINEIMKNMREEIDLQFMQKFIIKVAKMEALDLKRKGLANKNIIWIVLGAIVGVYMLLKAFGLNV